PRKAAALIGKTAQLELYDLEQDLTGRSVGAQGPVATSSLYDLLIDEQAKTKRGATEYYLFGRRKQLLEGQAQTRKALFTRAHPRVPRGGSVLGVPAGTVVVTCSATPQNPCPPNLTQGGPYYYLFKYEPNNKTAPIPEMTGADLK